MGYPLRREVADTLPPGLMSSGERMVVLEFADQANDQTRLAYGREILDIVARRCGFTGGRKEVGKILGKLAKRGIELRIQLRDDEGAPKVDKRGRPVFAHDGRSTTYSIPRFGREARTVPAAGGEWPGDGAAGGPPPGPLDAGISTGAGMVVPPAADHFSTGGPPDGPPPPPSGPPGGGAPPPDGPLDGPYAEISTGAPPEPAGDPPGGGPPAPSGPPDGSKWSPAERSVVPRPAPSGPPSGGPLSSSLLTLSSTSPQSVGAAARELQARRRLAGTYGLNDDECTTVIEAVLARSRRPVENLVGLLLSMTESGELADIVNAVQRATAAAAADEGQVLEEDGDERHLSSVPQHARTVRQAIADANPRAHRQPPLMQAVPDDLPPPAAAAEPTIPGPAFEAWREAKEALKAHLTHQSGQRRRGAS